MGIPTYKRRFLKWCQQRKYSLSELSFEHPTSGSTCAYHITKPKRHSDKLLIFVHGGGNNALYPMVHFFPEALEAGFDIFAFDLDGHGSQSTTLFNPKNITASLANTFAHIHQNYKYEKNFCIGHSLGGALLMSYLQTKSTPLDGISLWATPTNIDLNFKVLRKEFAGLWNRGLLSASRTYGIIDFIPSVGPIRRPELPFRPHPESNSKSFVSNVQSSLDIVFSSHSSPKIETPAFIVYGEKDLIAHPTALQTVEEYFKTSQSLVIPKATHSNLLFQNSLLEKTLSYWQTKNIF